LLLGTEQLLQYFIPAEELRVLQVGPCRLQAVLDGIEVYRPRLYETEGPSRALGFLEAEDSFALLLSAGKPAVDIIVSGELLTLDFGFLAAHDRVEGVGVLVLSREVPPLHTPKGLERCPSKVLMLKPASAILRDVVAKSVFGNLPRTQVLGNLD
jgi:hypothetical protein